MDKIIFLDIDGVLNNAYSLSRHVHLMPEKVRLVDALVRMTGAEIVISSAWRGDPNLTHMLWRVGLYKSGADNYPVTPHLDTGRGSEIDYFLRENGLQDANYIIIDDEDFDIHQKDRLIKTDHFKGIELQDIRKAAEMLGVNEYLYIVNTEESPGLPYHYFSENPNLTYEEVIEDIPMFKYSRETPMWAYNVMAGENLIPLPVDGIDPEAVYSIPPYDEITGE